MTHAVWNSASAFPPIRLWLYETPDLFQEAVIVLVEADHIPCIWFPTAVEISRCVTTIFNIGVVYNWLVQA